jgi:DNA-binding transcriptional MerR regulator
MAPTAVLARPPAATTADTPTTDGTVGIREAARLSGVPPHTLRWYEQIGLVPGIRRCAAGRRRYSRTDLRWIGVLRALRDTGMSVADLQDLAEQSSAGRVDRAVLVLRLHRARVLALMVRLQGGLGLLDAVEADLRRSPTTVPVR